MQNEGLWVVERSATRKTLLVSNGETLRFWSIEHDLCTLVPFLAIVAVAAPLVWLVWRVLWLPKARRGAGAAFEAQLHGR